MAEEYRRYDRQVRAFGSETQRLIGNISVGIVGLGGIGSHVAQQLAYLGIRELILVDRETVEHTNLNRLIGATLKDVGKPKVEVATRLVKAILPSARVLPLQVNLRSRTALDELKMADIIFGCVDDDGARLIMNELCLAYLIPYVDCGTEIILDGPKVNQAGGRVNLVMPGGPCLHCMGQIDHEEARISLAPGDEVQRARDAGYIQGSDEPSPAVVSLNGVVASLAVTEVISLIAGARKPSMFLEYDVLGCGRGRDAQWVTRRNVDKMEGCYECSLAGAGDASALERYVLDHRKTA